MNMLQHPKLRVIYDRLREKCENDVMSKPLPDDGKQLFAIVIIIENYIKN